MAASQGQRRRDAPVAEDQELPRIPFAVAPEPPPTALQSQGTARRVRLFVFGNPDVASRFEGRTQHSDVGHDDISPSAKESSDSLSTGSGGVEKKGQSSKTPPSLASIDSQEQDASSVSLLASVRCRCSCKGKCKTKRKPGKDRGCECKTEGVACNENCKCNRKKCENKVSNVEQDQISVSTRKKADALDNYQDQVDSSQLEIKEFVAKLSLEEKDKILIDLLSAGSGSLDYAQKLLVGDDGQGPGPSDQLSPTWCKCGVCIPMPTPDENKCCGKRTCITSYALFQQLCIDRNTLILAIRSRTDIRTDPLDVSMNSMRKQAYRQYVLWTLGQLGKGERRVNPSCVVKDGESCISFSRWCLHGFSI